MKYITDLVISETERFRQAVPITPEWSWSFQDHVLRTVHYKNSIFHDGYTESKPFKNIVRPILNLQYRAEGFDVKDIVIFISDSYKYFKSFLVRKFHDKWARENNLDTFIDEMVESYVDFGGALVKKTKDPIPEVVPLQRIAFCDQSDLLSGPICERHFYSPEELRTEAEGKGWENVEEAILFCENEKKIEGNNRDVKTPGKYIEVFELHGLFPRYCLSKDEYDEGYYEEGSKEKELVRQVQIVVLYKTDGDKGVENKGITLFKGPEKENVYKLILRDKIVGRALGLGGAEELFQSQVWTNYGAIRLKEMLSIASKVLFKTTDQAFANRNKTSNMSQGEILVLDEGKDIDQLDNTPRSAALFDRYIQDWEQHAQFMGAAGEAILGEEPAAGTPFKSVEFQASQSFSLHKYRQGKLATFLSEIYRDWILPHISSEITKGQTFLAELDMRELQEVADNLVICEANNFIKEKILNGEQINPEEVELQKQGVRESFMKGGNKKFIEILAGEMKKTPIDVEVNIAGKQKDLAGRTDKLVNIFRQIMQSINPQTGQSILDDPRMADIFNQILESSDFSPIDFSRKTQPLQPALVGAGQPVPTQ